jgi:hypothetical protein
VATARSEHRIPERSLVPERDPFDPLAALRAMGDVQRAGLEAAASVVERILELGRHGARMPYSFHLPAQPAEGTDSNGAHAVNGGDAEEDADTAGTGPASGVDAEADRAREVRRLRADGERLLEWWGEWMRVLLDAAVDGAEAGIGEREAAAREDRPLRLGPVKAGHRASGQAWVHILDGPPGPPARLSATALTAHDGSTIEARAASFEPPTLDSFDLRSTHELVVAVAVPAGTRPGAYHGHMLAVGLPEVSLAVCLEVTE